MRFLTKGLGWLLVALGLAVAAFEVARVCMGKHHDGTISVVLSAILLGGGALVFRAGRRMEAEGASMDPADAVAGPSTEERLLRIVTVARAHQGHVTAIEAAADGRMTVEQAREELERLARDNACQMDVSADGPVVFHFPGFEGREQKT